MQLGLESWPFVQAQSWCLYHLGSIAFGSRLQNQGYGGRAVSRQCFLAASEAAHHLEAGVLEPTVRRLSNFKTIAS